jgi:uncharacterized protein DUF6788
MRVKPIGSEASGVLKKKKRLLKGLHLPADALPGSLSQTFTRCGKKECHCSTGQKHPIWFLTYMDQGKKKVERIPEDWVEYAQQKVTQGKEFKENVNQVLVANAELLVLLRKQKQRR